MSGRGGAGGWLADAPDKMETAMSAPIETQYCTFSQVKAHTAWIRALERPIETRDACKLLLRNFGLSADPKHMEFLLDNTADSCMVLDMDLDVAAISQHVESTSAPSTAAGTCHPMPDTAARAQLRLARSAATIGKKTSATLRASIELEPFAFGSVAPDAEAEPPPIKRRRLPHKTDPLQTVYGATEPWEMKHMRARDKDLSLDLENSKFQNTEALYEWIYPCDIFRQRKNARRDLRRIYDYFRRLG